MLELVFYSLSSMCKLYVRVLNAASFHICKAGFFVKNILNPALFTSMLASLQSLFLVFAGTLQRILTCYRHLLTSGIVWHHEWDCVLRHMLACVSFCACSLQDNQNQDPPIKTAP